MKLRWHIFRSWLRLLRPSVLEAPKAPFSRKRIAKNEFFTNNFISKHVAMNSSALLPNSCPHIRLNSDLLSIWAWATMRWPHPNQLSPCWGPTSGQPDCESWSRAYNYSALSTPFNLSIMFHYVSVILSALASMSDVCRGEALIRLKQ